MDVHLDYSDDENPLSLKSDFILSLCELIVGGREGLQPSEKTVIDRVVRIVYQKYLNDPKAMEMIAGNMEWNIFQLINSASARLAATMGKSLNLWHSRY